jgi:hypothetical protein
MATISNTPRPGYVWDATDNVWYPIGTGPHSHADYITSGSAINPNIVDAKGDIIAATAADTVARLAVGSNNQVLTADSSTATGLKWATPSAGGMTLLSTTALNGVSTVTISSISQAYTDLYVICRYVYFPTGGSQLYINPNATNNISNGTIAGSTGATVTADAYQNGSIRAQAQSSASDPFNSFMLKISNYTEIYYRKAFEFYGYFIQSGGSAKCSFISGGGINVDDAITSIEVTNSVPRNFGNGGEVLIYGVK